MSTEIRTLHFDLRHLSHLPADTEFTLHAPGVGRHTLIAYKDSPGKMAEHRKLNKAICRMPEDFDHTLTHFVEDVELCDTQTTICQVLFPSLDEHPLPDIAVRFVNIPRKDLAASLAMHPHSSGTRALPRVVTHCGINESALDSSDRDAVHLDASDIKPPYEEAKTLVFLHPELGSVNPAVAQNVFENHIENAQSFTDLGGYLEDHPPGTSTPYYSKTYAMWTNPETKKEEPVPANTELKLKGSGKVDWPNVKVNGKDQPCIPQRELSGFDPEGDDTEVMEQIKKVVQEALITTKNDDTLNGQLWTKQNGVTAKGKNDVSPDQSVAPMAEAVEAAAPPKNEFVLKNLTSTYGTDVYPLTWDNGQQVLTLPVRNWASRYLSAYVEFFEEDGTPIKKGDITKPRAWDDKLPSFLRGAFEASDEKQYLDLISAGTAIFGIPVPPLDNVANLSFMWPQQATTANVLMGGLGVAEGFRDWDTDVDLGGVLATGLITYGITGLSMAFTVKIANPFMWGLKGDAKFAFYAIAGVLGVSAAVVDIGVEGTEKGGKRILGIIAKKAAGMIFSSAVTFIEKKVWKEAMEAIIGEAVGELSAEEALIEIPIAGEILQVASVAADIAGLLATTIECFLSPATYKIEIQRKMTLKVDVGPDHANGKDGVYNWPLVADHYVVQVKYPKGNGQQGGTVYTQAGPMPGDPTQHIQLEFEGIPAGGKIDVSASIYSENNWLAGRWDSGWINAKPDGNDEQSVGGNITQNLVPLTPTTKYSQKQTLAYSDARKHFWEVTKFSVKADLATDLDKGGAPSVAIKTAFAERGNDLSAGAKVTVNTVGQDWTLADSGVDFHIWKKQISDVNNQKLYELEVQNTTNPAPVYVKPNTSPGGHALAQLQNITISNKEFELGYAWRASVRTCQLTMARRRKIRSCSRFRVFQRSDNHKSKLFSQLADSPTPHL